MTPSRRAFPPRGIRRFLPVLLSIPIFGCAPALYPLPKAPVSDPGLLLARMEARQAGLRAVSAVGRAESRMPEGRMKGRVTLLADLSGRLRVDVWTPTDVLVGAVSAGPDGFSFFQRGEGCLVGKACPSNLALVLPRGWDLFAVVRGLMGIAPLVPAAGGWSLEFDRRNGAYRLQSPIAGGDAQRLWLREDGEVVRYERGREGRVAILLVVEEPPAAAGRPARKVRLGTGSGDSELAIRYGDVEVNPEVAPEDWPVVCPEGLPVRFLTCERGP